MSYNVTVVVLTFMALFDYLSFLNARSRLYEYHKLCSNGEFDWSEKDFRSSVKYILQRIFSFLYTWPLIHFILFYPIKYKIVSIILIIVSTIFSVIKNNIRNADYYNIYRIIRLNRYESAICFVLVLILLVPNLIKLYK